MGIPPEAERLGLSHSAGVAPSNEGRHQEAPVGVPIGESCAVRRHHRSARGGKHGVSGRNIPLVGRGEARVDIGCALGEEAELQRGATGDTLGNRQPTEQRF